MRSCVCEGRHDTGGTDGSFLPVCMLHRLFRAQCIGKLPSSLLYILSAGPYHIVCPLSQTYPFCWHWTDFATGAQTSFAGRGETGSRCAVTKENGIGNAGAAPATVIGNGQVKTPLRDDAGRRPAWPYISIRHGYILGAHQPGDRPVVVRLARNSSPGILCQLLRLPVAAGFPGQCGLIELYKPVTQSVSAL